MSTSLHPLANIAGVLAVLNNIFLLSAPWIASLTKPPKGQPALQGPSPIVAAGLYAIWQPICLGFILWTGMPMWLHLFSWAPQHLLMATIFIGNWHKEQSRKAWEDIANAKTTDHYDSEHERQTSFLYYIKSLRNSENYVWTVPIFTAATSDATLVAFVAELISYPDTYSSSTAWTTAWVYHYLAFLAMVCYLAGRYTDYWVATLTHRRGIYAFDSYTWRERLLVFGLLAMLFTIRAGVAWLLEQFCNFPLLSLALWPKGVKIVLDRSIPEMIDHVREMMPWLPPSLSLASIPLQILLIYLVQRMAREDRR